MKKTILILLINTIFFASPQAKAGDQFTYTNQFEMPRATDILVPEVSRSGTFRFTWRSSGNPYEHFIDPVYYVQRISSNEEAIFIGATMDPFFDEISLAQGAYTYRVFTCLWSCTASEISSQVRIDTNVPFPPENITVTIDEREDIIEPFHYEWDAAENTSYYQIEVEEYDVWEIFAQPVYTYYSVPPGFYRIRSCNESGCGESTILNVNDPFPCSNFPFCEQE